MLAEKNRRPKLHEAVGRFLEVDDARSGARSRSRTRITWTWRRPNCSRTWPAMSARGPGSSASPAVRPTPGSRRPTAPAVVRIELEPLAPERCAADDAAGDRAASAADARAGGRGAAVGRQSAVPARPAALGDRSGGIGGLPDSAEAGGDGADRCAGAGRPRAGPPRRRVRADVPPAHAVVARRGRRRCPAPEPATWARLRELFEEEPDGYLRFRRSLLRDAAYEGLPYKLRRRLHGAVAARLEEEMDDAGGRRRHPVAALLRSGRVPSGMAVRHGRRQARPRGLCLRRSGRVCTRARWRPAAASRMSATRSSPPCTRRWGMRGTGRASSRRRPSAIRPRAGWSASDPLAEAGLLLKRSRLEEKLGKMRQALRWAARARKALAGLTGPEAARQAARVERLVRDGAAGAKAERTRRSDWAERAVVEAEAADDPEALGGCVFRDGVGVRRARQGRRDSSSCSVRWRRTSARATW